MSDILDAIDSVLDDDIKCRVDRLFGFPEVTLTEADLFMNHPEWETFQDCRWRFEDGSIRFEPDDIEMRRESEYQWSLVECRAPGFFNVLFESNDLESPHAHLRTGPAFEGPTAYEYLRPDYIHRVWDYDRSDFDSEPED